MKKQSVWLLASLVALGLVGCAGQKEPAEKALARAQSALGAIHDAAQKYAPDELQVVETQLAGAKDSLAKGDYKGVLAAAPALTAAIGALKDTAEAKEKEAEANGPEQEGLVSSTHISDGTPKPRNRKPRSPETQCENADAGGICTLHGCWTEPAGSAACMTLLTIGPAIPAPSDEMFWNGTTTATAIWGLLAGAKPIIQSWLTDSPVWAVPVLTAAHR